MNPHDMNGNKPTDVRDPEASTSNMEGKSCKRAYDDNDCEIHNDSTTSAPPTKVPKLSESCNGEVQEQPSTNHSTIDSTASLLTLSDDVLLHIFGYLDSVTLTKLNRACHRLKNICSDSTLWKTFDTNGVALTVKELRTMVKYFNKRTTSIIIQGFLKVRSKMHHESITSATLRNISEKCTELGELKLKDCFIDAQNGTKITNFRWCF